MDAVNLQSESPQFLKPQDLVERLESSKEESKNSKVIINRVPVSEWKAKSVYDYDLDWIIGKGTFGKVFKAKLKNIPEGTPPEIVALK